MLHRSPYRRLFPLLMVLLGLASWPADAVGPEPPPRPLAAMRATLDPATGEMVARPSTIALGEESTRALSRSSQGLVREPHPLGGEMVNLRGRFMSLSVARVEEDGSIVQSCVDDEQQARAFLERWSRSQGAVR